MFPTGANGNIVNTGWRLGSGGVGVEPIGVRHVG
jgi:hypothetical protein